MHKLEGSGIGIDVIVNRHITSLRRKIPWDRFWVQLGGHIDCGHNGFLTDPEANRYGKAANPDVERLINLLPEAGPIILCGEPGVGKTTKLENLRENLERDPNTDGENLFWVVFREIADLTEFRRQTVESAPWLEWRVGTRRLTLIIDGVDEGLMRVPNFLIDLVALLKNEPLDRLRLILACRTAEWPMETGQTLLALWPTKAAEPIYELCPLRQRDAESAALFYGCEPEPFLNAVRDKSVVALAARPITLFFLLKEFRQHKALPSSHRELCERGTANLVTQVKESLPPSEESIEDLERQIPSLSASTLEEAHRQALAAGHRVLVSEDGGIYELFQDGTRKLVKTTGHPLSLPVGTRARIP